MNKIILLGILIAAVVGYFYYSQTKISSLNSLVAEQAITIATQEQTIVEIKKIVTKQINALNQLNESNSTLNKEKDELVNKLIKHDLEELSKAKPGLVEKRINDATKTIIDEFNSITAN